MKQLHALVLCALFLLSGCGSDDGPTNEVVLYTAVDEPVARRIIDAFTEETGIPVRLVTDTEATKSVGLAERLRAEQNRPQADVWWGNDPFYTVGLAEEGLLQPYESPSLEGIDEQYTDPDHRWAGNGLRARVLAISTGNPPSTEGDWAGLASLTDPALQGKVVIGRPTAGTTGGHVASIYELWGQEKADDFFRDLHGEGIALVAGNSQVAQQVGAGNFSIGLTDNDDVANAIAAGLDIKAVLPDQGEDGIGTLTIPTTVGLVAGRPESEDAKKLIDYLLSAEAEQELIDASFVAYSVRQAQGDLSVKAMPVDYAAVARGMPEAIRRATALLEGREP